MATCLSLLGVSDIAQTIQWYERLGFKCRGTNQEPGCPMDWAMLDLDGAAFMLFLNERGGVSTEKDGRLYFYMESIDEMIKTLKNVNAHIIEINEETFYGRREITIKDINGFLVTFSCEPKAK